jgi:hypothetical protein
MPECMCGAYDGWSKNTEMFYENFVKVKIIDKTQMCRI